MKSNEIKSNQIKWNQIKWNEMKWNLKSDRWWRRLLRTTNMTIVTVVVSRENNNVLWLIDSLQIFGFWIFWISFPKPSASICRRGHDRLLVERVDYYVPIFDSLKLWCQPRKWKQIFWFDLIWFEIRFESLNVSTTTTVGSILFWRKMIKTGKRCIIHQEIPTVAPNQIQSLTRNFLAWCISKIQLPG